MGNTRLSYTDSDKDGYINDTNRYLFEEDFATAERWSPTLSLTRGGGGEDRSGSILNTSSTEVIAELNDWIDIDITEPTDYTFAGWVYSNGPQAELMLLMKEAGETDYMTDHSYIQYNITNAWSYISKTVTVQPNIKKLKLRLENDGLEPSGWGVILFDDLILRKDSFSNEIVEEDNYYAFGMKHEGYNDIVTSTNPAQKYKSKDRNVKMNWDLTGIVLNGVIMIIRLVDLCVLIL